MRYGQLHLSRRLRMGARTPGVSRAAPGPLQLEFSALCIEASEAGVTLPHSWWPWTHKLTQKG